MSFVHQVPKALQRAVTLMTPQPGMLCSDCRQPLQLGRPWVRYKDEQLCLTDARDRGLVVAVRRPRVAMMA